MSIQTEIKRETRHAASTTTTKSVMALMRKPERHRARERTYRCEETEAAGARVVEANEGPTREQRITRRGRTRVATLMVSTTRLPRNATTRTESECVSYR